MIFLLYLVFLYLLLIITYMDHTWIWIRLIQVKIFANLAPSRLNIRITTCIRGPFLSITLTWTAWTYLRHWLLHRGVCIVFIMSSRTSNLQLALLLALAAYFPEYVSQVLLDLDWTVVVLRVLEEAMIWQLWDRHSFFRVFNHGGMQ